MSPSKVKAFLGRIQLVAETRAPSVSVPSTPVLALRAWVLTAPTASLGIGCRQLVGFQALPSPKPASRCALRRPLDAAPLSVLRQCFTGSIGLLNEIPFTLFMNAWLSAVLTRLRFALA